MRDYLFPGNHTTVIADGRMNNQTVKKLWNSFTLTAGEISFEKSLLWLLLTFGELIRNVLNWDLVNDKFGRLFITTMLSLESFSFGFFFSLENKDDRRRRSFENSLIWCLWWWLVLLSLKEVSKMLSWWIGEWR